MKSFFSMEVKMRCLLVGTDLAGFSNVLFIDLRIFKYWTMEAMAIASSAMFLVYTSGE